MPEREREPRGADGKDPPAERVTEALLILKFGGVLTHLGKNQAEFLGRDFRMRMYPGGNYYDRGAGTDGLLRLHSTYRHDLKIYSSDEGRVQITAAAFAKGLLDLETENHQLTPILASLVNKDAKLLDFVTHEVEEDILHAKQKLYNIMTEGHARGREDEQGVLHLGHRRHRRRHRARGAGGLPPPVVELAHGHARAEATRPDDDEPGEGRRPRRRGARPPTPTPTRARDAARRLRTGPRGDPTPAASAGVERADAILGTGGVSGGARGRTRRLALVHHDGRRPQPRAEDGSALDRVRGGEGPPPEEPSMRKRSSENDLQKRAEEEEEEEEEDHPPGGARDPPSRTSALTREMRGLEVSAADDRESGGADASSDPGSPGGFRRRGSVGAAAAQGGGAGSQADHQPRSSWNAGDAKALLKSRLAMGLPEDFATRLADEGGYLRRVGRVRRGIRAAPRAAHVSGRRRPVRRGRDSRERGGVHHAPSPPAFPRNRALKLLRLMVELIGSLTHQLRREIFQHGKVHHVAGAEHAGGRA